MALTLNDGAAKLAAPKPPKLASVGTSALPPILSQGLTSSNPGSAYTGIVASGPTYTPSSLSSVGTSAVAPAATSAVAGTDYGSQLANDPILQQQLAGINAQGTANSANLTAQRQQALAQFGQIPDNLSGQLTGDVNSDINQTTRDLANAATQGGVSTVAQLLKAYQNQTQGDNASLAARGLIHSGALGQHANTDLTAYQQSQYDATQKLLDYLGQAYQGYLANQQTLQGSSVDATNQALSRIYAMIQAGLLGGSASSSSDAGTPQAQPLAPAGGEALTGTNIYGGALPSVAANTPLPASPTAPYTTNVTANKTGGSANKKQGVFAIH